MSMHNEMILFTQMLSFFNAYLHSHFFTYNQSEIVRKDILVRFYNKALYPVKLQSILSIAKQTFDNG
jgi:hypothetical protein